jgi:hypothetical protein
MTAKLKEKRTSITTVPSIFESFTTFPTHLLFPNPLILRLFLKAEYYTCCKWSVSDTVGQGIL